MTRAGLLIECASPTTLPGLDAVGLIIPTYNAERHWPELSESLHAQGLRGDQILIVDSSSRDRTAELARESGFQFLSIPQREFRHGATRQMACGLLPKAELLVFMTQDAILDGPDAVRKLCAGLADPLAGAAYGRQAPRPESNPIERHARLFNYPEVTQVRTWDSRHSLGIKAAFCSNSFAVYRREALEAVGGFPVDVILAEDSVVAARLLMAGWKVIYQADAVAIHSHPIRLRQEFSRYFDTGVHHARERWLQQAFGGAGREGSLFLRSELRYLANNAPHMLPLALLRTVNKLLAYRLGKLHKLLPKGLNRRISAYPNFWSMADNTAVTSKPVLQVQGTARPYKPANSPR